MAVPKPTIKGKPVQSGMEHMVPVRHTDAGVEEFNRGKEPARVQIISDPFEKLLVQHENSPAEQPWQHTDPVHSLVATHGRAGMKNRLLSEGVVAKRGLRGWQPVRDDAGNLVKLGTSVLAEMPADLAEQRAAHFREQSSSAVRAAKDELIEKQERLASDSGAAGIGPLESNQIMEDAQHPGRVIESGLQVRRGESI
jgi:hypothetical protein